MDNGSLFDPPNHNGGGSSKELAPFEFPFTGAQVRAVLIDGEPWFVAADVCAILGYGHSGSALRMLRDRQKGEHPMHTPGGLQNLKIINEPGLYRLVMRSNRPDAEAFQDWVTDVVLPEIRRTGSYGAPVPQQRRELTNRELAMMVIAEADRADLAEAKVKELTPGYELAETYAAAKGTMTVRTFARNVQQWAQPRGIKVLQEHVFDFLGMIGMVIRSKTSEKGQATATAIKAGWCENSTTAYETHTRGALLTTYARLTPQGVDHAWKRIHSAIGKFGTLDPKVIRP